MAKLSTAEKAHASIKKKGQAITFSRVAAVYDPVPGTHAATAPTTWDGFALRTAAYSGSKAQIMDISFKESLVIGRACFLIVPAFGLTNTPIPGDKVTLADSTVWAFVGVNELNPDGTPILYSLGVVRV